MCGICGLLAPRSNANPDLLRRMNSCLVHRGPDDEGYYEAPGIGLAARRLSIIDLPGGHQPIGNEDGTIWLAYNGEVYNHPALRRQLLERGHVFGTQSDTETIVHAYEEWGEACVAQLRGMFAFALWDGPRRRLLLARDRFGIKPLYYAQSEGMFAFGSELRPILTALPALPRRADPGALWDLLGLGFVPSPRTVIAGLCKLPAAHTLTVEVRGDCLHLAEPQRYWNLQFPRRGGHRPIAVQEAAQLFVGRLRQAVDVWRLSDVPVGSLLSGGIDSASLAALLQETSGTKIATFSIGFEAASHDESAQARATARYLGSDHHELTFTAADFDLLPQAIRHLEEPQGSATSVPIYLLYRACREAGFKVILTGEGSDELLGGYHWHVGDARIRRFHGLPRPARSWLARLPFSASTAARRVLREAPADPVDRYALWQTAATVGERAALLTDPPNDNGQLADQWRAEFGESIDSRAPLEQFLYIESRTRLIDFINFTVDRMSMASSIEARPPFLDHELWEFTASLPPECKLEAGFGTGPTSGNKRLLRLGMAGRLPPDLLRRPKRGLATPHAGWWQAEQLPPWAEAAVSAGALAETGYFNPAEVSRLRALHRAGQADHSRVLMAVLTTQLWHDEFAR